MGNRDERSSNRKPGIPSFDFSKRNRVEVSAYKMTTGYLLINQDNGNKHPMTADDDVRQTFQYVGEDLTIDVMERLRNIHDGDFIAVTIIIEEKTNEQLNMSESQFEFNGPPELDFSQLAQMLTDIVNGDYLTGVPGLSPMGRQKVKVTPQVIAQYLRSGDFIRIAKTPTFTSQGGKGKGHEPQSANKPFFHDDKTKNKDRGDKAGGGQGGQEGQNKAEPNKIE